ncbi:hypothetical protein F7725_002897 [Dissostichus mawsoni]|uniref:Aldehyde dehydrogenase domain-containing protein n=1 Tax=Dissostichus mawsoni TaxID=36200 RepID=A0A7J5YAL8_DISMA|nr:hypothetical protein F7725_002897 [Dissostichus mawsoni]
METHSQILNRLRSAFRSGITVPEAFRQAQLKQLMSLMTENEDQILDALKKDLAKPKFESIIAEVDMATKLDDCFVRREPLGVVLIIGPWNYPLQLLLSPLIAAIGAGSQAVARHILHAAADHLTPVTLELGGKCPCLIYGKVNITYAARRLAWSKFFNTGQSCVAPDFLVCSKATRDALLPALRQTLEDFYSKEPESSADLPRIVSPRHWTRLMELLKRSKGKVVMGGESNEENKYIAPTVLVDVAEDDALMEEEIFGPFLPILTAETLEEAIALINRQEKPLALYVFSEESSVRTSGFGSYHGRWGFETLSHQRAVMLRGWTLERLNGLRYPPYTEDKLSWLRWTTSAKPTAQSVMCVCVCVNENVWDILPL